MEAIDKKILYELSENARASKNAIASKLNISREVLLYRINRLKKSGLIIGICPRINISNFIYMSYIYMIKSLGNNSEEIETKIRNHVNTFYFGKLGWRYNYVIRFNVRNLNELYSYMDFINEVFGKVKIEAVILTMLTEVKDSFKQIFSDTQEINNIITRPRISKKEEIDEKDANILSILIKNGEAKYSEISEKIKMSEVAVKKRIKNLENKKIILGYRTFVDINKLELNKFYIFLKTNIAGINEEKKLQTYLQLDSKCTYASKLLGEFDYVATFLCIDNEQLKIEMTKIKENFIDTILEITAYPLLEIICHKQTPADFISQNWENHNDTYQNEIHKRS